MKSYSNELPELYLKSLPEIIKTNLPKDCIAFPGFVNAHDHLDFNLFPQLTTRLYNDYIDWGEDLHRSHHEEIQKVLNVPLELRIKFGLLKNLVNGFAGVVHHGNHVPLIKSLSSYPVWSDYRYIHSIATDPLWKLKLFLSIKSVMIHLGEGTSATVANEIDQLIRWNVLKKNVIPVHALGLTAQQAKKFKSVIWCPLSNINLYDKTLSAANLFDQTNLMFGTDSTLTADANVWKHFRFIQKQKLLTEEDLFQILIRTSYDSYFSSKTKGNTWIIARRKNSGFLNSFFQIDPQDILLVWINGTSWLCDESLSLHPKQAVPIKVGDSKKWINAEFANVVSAIEQFNIQVPLEIRSV